MLFKFKKKDEAPAKEYLSAIDCERENKLEFLGRIYTSAIGEMMEFRMTMAKILFWYASVTLFIVGWIVTKNPQPSTKQGFIFAGAIIVFNAYGLYFTKKMESYFLVIAQVINRIDFIHGSHKKGEYLEKETLYPDGWKKFGDKDWKEPIFKAAYWGICLIGSLSVMAVLSLII